MLVLELMLLLQGQLELIFGMYQDYLKRLKNTKMVLRLLYLLKDLVLRKKLLFLVSDAASYVTGSIYAVDGGQGAL